MPNDFIIHNHDHDGIDRRGFLQCMAWAGTGLLWTITGVRLGTVMSRLARGRAQLQIILCQHPEISGGRAS